MLDAAHQLSDQLGELSEPTQALLVALANRAATTWGEPDAGMWEARDRQRQYVSSKVLCWVALDRAIALSPRPGAGADPPRWERARQQVRDAVLTKAWSDEAGAYAGAFGSDQLDASVLLLPLSDFFPPTILGCGPPSRPSRAGWATSAWCGAGPRIPWAS